jgi:hypothetical protein
MFFYSLSLSLSLSLFDFNTDIFGIFKWTGGPVIRFPRLVLRYRRPAYPHTPTTHSPNISPLMAKTCQADTNATFVVAVAVVLSQLMAANTIIFNDILCRKMLSMFLWPLWKDLMINW